MSFQTCVQLFLLLNFYSFVIKQQFIDFVCEAPKTLLSPFKGK